MYAAQPLLLMLILQLIDHVPGPSGADFITDYIYTARPSVQPIKLTDIEQHPS